MNHHPPTTITLLLAALALLVLLLTACASQPAAQPATQTPAMVATATTDDATPHSDVPLTPTHRQATAALTTTATLTPTAQMSRTHALSATLPASPTLDLWTTETGKALAMVRTLAQEWSSQQALSMTVTAKDPDSLRVDLLTADLLDEPAPHMLWGNQDDLAGLLQDGSIQPVTPTVPLADYLPAMVDGAMLDGELWGYPLAVQDVLLLLFNRRYVDAPPQTTDELIAQARAFAEAGQEQSADAPASPRPSAGLVAAWGQPRWLLPWLSGFGGNITTPDGTKPTIVTQPMTDTLYLLRELYATAPDGQWLYAEASNLFGTGQAAFVIDGTWAISRYQHLTPTLDLGIASMPVVPATGKIAASPPGASYLMLHAHVQGEERALVHDFAALLAAPDNQLRFASTLSRLPALKDLLNDPVVSGDPLLAAVAAQAQQADGIPPTRAYRCALDAVNTFLLPPLLKGEDEQAETLQKMQQHAEACGERWNVEALKR
jgi:arabinogalactan oligomer/maltooligosaccharide transport system substrate-binding protein